MIHDMLANSEHKTEMNILNIVGERRSKEPSFELWVERLFDDLIY